MVNFLCGFSAFSCYPDPFREVDPDPRKRTEPSGSGSTKIIFVLRDLKASKADKATITGEVKVLLELKAKFKVLYVCMYIYLYVYIPIHPDSQYKCDFFLVIFS